MALTPPKKFVIGQRGWADRVRRLTDDWHDFTSVSEAEISSLERDIHRELPNDLREFLKVFGYGGFTEFGANIYSPDDIIAACPPGPLWMQLGSANWASEEAHPRYYILALFLKRPLFWWPISPLMTIGENEYQGIS
jgi:hypothetical protein